MSGKGSNESPGRIDTSPSVTVVIQTQCGHCMHVWRVHRRTGRDTHSSLRNNLRPHTPLTGSPSPAIGAGGGSAIFLDQPVNVRR